VCNFFGATSFPFKYVKAFEEMAVSFDFTSLCIEDCVGMKKRVEDWLMSTHYFLVDEVSNLWWESSGDAVGGFDGALAKILTVLLSVCHSPFKISVGCGWWHPWKFSRERWLFGQG
jgi:hypothetical protein